jgi:hypothetical protein
MKQVLLALAAAGMMIGSLRAQDVNTRTFHLTAVPQFVDCISDQSGNPPSATVTVNRGRQNDTLSLTVRHIKPGLTFDLFTVQRSNLLSNGTRQFCWIRYSVSTRT